jgi:Protein of unknown function (DUF4232)
MPEELDTLFHAAAQQLDRALLADPADLRAEGTRRRRARTGATAAAAALLVAALAGGGFALRDYAGSHPAPVASTPAPTGAASPSAGSSPSAGTSPSPAGAGGACTAAQLSSPAMVGGEGAAGSSYLVLTVINESAGGCTLSGVPTLWGTNGGATVKLPQHATSGAGAGAVLGAGRAATLTIRTVNGNPAGGVQCHSTVLYQDLQLDLGTGARYHAGANLAITCGNAEVSGWNTSLPPLCGTANFPQPAVVSGIPGGARIVLTNASAQPCLMATAPALRYTDSGGTSGELPGDTIGGPATIPGHGTAVMIVSAAQDSGCAAVTYHDLSVQAGTDRLAIPGTIDLPCPGAHTEGWETGG